MTVTYVSGTAFLYIISKSVHRHHPVCCLLPLLSSSPTWLAAPSPTTQKYSHYSALHSRLSDPGLGLQDGEVGRRIDGGTGGVGGGCLLVLIRGSEPLMMPGGGGRAAS